MLCFLFYFIFYVCVSCLAFWLCVHCGKNVRSALIAHAPNTRVPTTRGCTSSCARLFGHGGSCGPCAMCHVHCALSFRRRQVADDIILLGNVPDEQRTNGNSTCCKFLKTWDLRPANIISAGSARWCFFWMTSFIGLTMWLIFGCAFLLRRKFASKVGDSTNGHILGTSMHFRFGNADELLRI